LEKKTFHEFQLETLLLGNQKLADSIKILLYQADKKIFNRLDFNNDRIYLEPLLFALFNSKNSAAVNIEPIIYGFTELPLRPKQIEVISDQSGKIYLPNVGWLEVEQPNLKYDLLTNEQGKICLQLNGKTVSYVVHSLEFIEGTKIELLKYPIPLLNQFYYDVKGASIDVEIEIITERNKIHLITAFNLIKKHSPEHFDLIQLACAKCVIFNVDTYLRNSFATLSAQGISFFNAYQENYNEVFFVDDIAHQSGHVIFNALIYEINDFMLLNPDTILQNVKVDGVLVETRNFHVIFHALYTYYTTFTCLSACLDAGCFEGEKYHEALGRIRCYIDKCYQDLLLIDNPVDSDENSKRMFTESGLIIYKEIKSTFKMMVTKWGNHVKDFNLNNQPYNFTYSKFVELNPLK
jgi:hypothetical protein